MFVIVWFVYGFKSKEFIDFSKKITTYTFIIKDCYYKIGFLSNKQSACGTNTIAKASRLIQARTLAKKTAGCYKTLPRQVVYL